ncbi:MAG: DUF1269 domain-containing protein [Anaerolineales bacterium]
MAKKSKKKSKGKSQKKLSEAPVQLIVAAFQDEKAADQALKDLKKAKKKKEIAIKNAAMLRKDENGKLHIKETADMGGGKGAALGGVAGAVIGLIAGPALVVPVAVGALVGGLTAKLKDSGFSDQRLESLGDGLVPGSSAIVAVVEPKWAKRVERELSEQGADLLTSKLQADIASQLEAGSEVAYTAVTTQEGIAVGRVAGDADQVEGAAVVIDDTGVYGGRFIATGAGFAVERITVTDEGSVDEVVAAAGDTVAYAATVVTDEGSAAGGMVATVEEDVEEEIPSVGEQG